MKTIYSKILYFFTAFYLASFNTSALASVDEIYAIVNKDPITKQEFHAKKEYLMTKYKAFGKTPPPQKQFEREVLKELVDSSLQLQLAEQNGIEVYDIEVREAIAGVAVRNKVSYAELKRNIISSGQDFAAYKEEIRNELLMSKLQQQFIRPSQVTENQINEYLAAQGKQNKSTAYHLEDIRVSLPDDTSNDDLLRAKTIADRLIKEASNNKIRNVIDKITDDKYPILISDLGYQPLNEMPIAFAKIVPKLKKGGLSTPIETPNGIHILHLIDTKPIEPTSFVVQMHIHHILIRPDSIGGSYDEAKKIAEQIAKDIRSGQDFLEAAKTKSHDTQSAPNGGELGWVTSEELPPTLALASLQLEKKKVSDPIESQAGWHLLYIKDTKKVDVSKDRERKQAMQILHQKEVADQLEKWLVKLRHTAYIKILKKELQD